MLALTRVFSGEMGEFLVAFLVAFLVVDLFLGFGAVEGFGFRGVVGVVEFAFFLRHGVVVTGNVHIFVHRDLGMVVSVWIVGANTHTHRCAIVVGEGEEAACVLISRGVLG